MDETNFWLIGAGAAVFFGAIFIYVMIMVFFPEWVGITGKVALEAERSHREGAQAKDDDITVRMQKRKDAGDTRS
jgi:hypothetical protein